MSDSHTYILRSREQVKDELIQAQDQRNRMLGWTATAFAGELLAKDFMSHHNPVRAPLVFGLSIAALGTILGDVHYAAKVGHLKHELNSSTQLHRI